jgi:hypothetical protein
MRIVPPDSARQLTEKQILLITKLSLTDINDPKEIKAPTDAVPLNEVVKDYDGGIVENSLGDARQRAETAALKSNVNSIRTAAELAYDKSKGFGVIAFPLGPCKKTPQTLFADVGVAKSIESATKNNMSLATCSSSKTSYAVSVPLPHKKDFSYCVDSTGSAVEILGKLEGNTCR